MLSSFSFCMFCVLSSVSLWSVPNFAWPYCLSKNGVGGISFTSFPICLGSVGVLPLALELAGWKRMVCVLFLAPHLPEKVVWEALGQGTASVCKLCRTFILLYFTSGPMCSFPFGRASRFDEKFFRMTPCHRWAVGSKCIHWVYFSAF